MFVRLVRKMLFLCIVNRRGFENSEAFPLSYSGTYLHTHPSVPFKFTHIFFLHS